MVIILDTNVILRFPKVLGLKIVNTSIVVTSEVVEELNENSKKNRIGDDLFELIQTALNAGSISIFNSDLPEVLHYESKLQNVFSKVDKSLITTAFFFRDRGEEVFIATLDREVQSIAISNSVSIYSLEDLKKFSVSNSEKTGPILEKIHKYEKSEKISSWISLIIGSLTTAIVLKGFDNLSGIISTINVWGTIVLIIILGILLFILREKRRLSYGIFEFLIGIIAIILLFQPSNFDYTKLKLSMDFSIKLLGGLYIMVRGQDNIVKSLKNKKLGLILKERFGIGD